MKNIFLVAVAIMFATACQSQQMLTTVNKLNLDKYQGKWYEIARLPNSFERNLTMVTATYTVLANGKVDVLNQGYKNGVKRKSIKGKAWVPDKDFPGRLKVRFFWPFSGDYYVIALDEDYQYALVGSPSRKFLWILAREPQISKEVYEKYVQIAMEHDFRVEELIKVDQSLHINDK